MMCMPYRIRDKQKENIMRLYLPTRCSLYFTQADKPTQKPGSSQRLCDLTDVHDARTRRVMNILVAHFDHKNYGKWS